MSETVCQQRRWQRDMSVTDECKCNQMRWTGLFFTTSPSVFFFPAAYFHPFFLFTFSSMWTKVFDRENNSLNTSTVYWKQKYCTFYLCLCFQWNITNGKKTLIKYIRRIWYPFGVHSLDKLPCLVRIWHSWSRQHFLTYFDISFIMLVTMTLHEMCYSNPIYDIIISPMSSLCPLPQSFHWIR